MIAAVISKDDMDFITGKSDQEHNFRRHQRAANTLRIIWHKH